MSQEIEDLMHKKEGKKILSSNKNFKGKHFIKRYLIKCMCYTVFGSRRQLVETFYREPETVKKYRESEPLTLFSGSLSWSR